jgi:hypothetical protein
MDISKLVILIVSFLIMTKGVEFILLARNIVKSQKEINRSKFFVIGVIEFILGFVLFIFFFVNHINFE